MKNALFFSTILLLVVGCSSSTQSMTSSSAPGLEIHLKQLGNVPDLYYFRGPVNIQYELQIVNPTNQTFKLRRLNLSTVGPGAYSLRTGESPVNYTIPPGTTTITVSAWGHSAGGFLRSTEPVDIRGLAVFEGPNGSFVKQFTQYIPQ